MLEEYGKESIRSRAFLNKIMSSQEYANRRDEFEDVCLVELENANKQLTAIGVVHENDVLHEQFALLQGKIETVKPDLVLVEGMSGLREKQERFKKYLADKTFEEIVSAHGESLGVLYLALQKNIEVDSPEPSDHAIISQLLKQGFPREAIYLQQVLRMVSQWSREGKAVSLEEYVHDTRAEMQQELGIDISPDMYGQISGLANRIGISLTSDGIQNSEKMSVLSDPIPWEGKQMTEINKVSDACGVIRDTHILLELEKTLMTHDSVMIVFGSSHIHMLESALEELMRSV